MIRLTAALVKQATHVLAAHLWGLLGAALAVLVTFGLVCAGLVLATATLLSNGAYELPEVSEKARGGFSGDSPPECTWVLQSGWVGYGAGFCALVLLWTTSLAFLARFYTVSLVTACWWYDKSIDAAHNASDSPSHSDDDRSAAAVLSSPLASRGPAALARQRPVRTALQLAAGPSFGTLCFAAIVMSICRLLDYLARSVRRRSNNLVAALVLACLQSIIQLVEMLNRFALIFHSIDGKPFCTSARHMRTLLARHGLSAYVVDSFSGVVVGVGAISGGILAGLLSAATFERVLRADQTLTDEARAAAAAVFGGLAAAAAVSTLGFLGALLLNAVDACYVCFALDLEALRNCQPQVSAVLLQIAKPTTSFVVQNPGECMPTVLGEAVQH